MGFRRNWDVADILSQLRSAMLEASSAYNDGWTASGAKHDIFQIKCFIEDNYKNLPHFIIEDEWHKKRMVEKLKRSE